MASHVIEQIDSKGLRGIDRPNALYFTKFNLPYMRAVAEW